ncbi:Aste57867_15822 [Aphanomyces stellatus]|uniref:Aste57867_15822 protein n=1 Tax=Aphanomyces stellatus TaxID=120398 RepID=A0A485L414_9STRA|nr:hypothetical protein As57867_015766 [Aphanomyces stellatus]VFT92610.1 Aste57867_15822 [Aphanomyces stellatus]
MTTIKREHAHTHHLAADAEPNLDGSFNVDHIAPIPIYSPVLSAAEIPLTADEFEFLDDVFRESTPEAASSHFSSCISYSADKTTVTIANQNQKLSLTLNVPVHQFQVRIDRFNKSVQVGFCLVAGHCGGGFKSNGFYLRVNSGTVATTIDDSKRRACLRRGHKGDRVTVLFTNGHVYFGLNDEGLVLAFSNIASFVPLYPLVYFQNGGEFTFVG